MAEPVPVPASDPDSMQRFMAKVRILPSGCWEWTGARFVQGYGMFSLAGSARRAHRVLYVWTHGELSEGRKLDHVCHSNDPTCEGGYGCAHRRCVNPDHLEPVTSRTNVRRGRSSAAVKAQASHCVNGHPFSKENTRFDAHGWRICVTCRRLGSARRRPVPQRPNGAPYCKNGHVFGPKDFDWRGHRRCKRCSDEWRHAHRRAKGIRPKTYGDDKQSCWHGHPATPHNIGVDKTGYRFCKECGRIRAREYQRRKREATNP